MNMSSRGTLNVESFIYQNIGASASASDPFKPAGSDTVQDVKPPADGVPRISEQELSRLVYEARAEGVREGQQQVRAGFDQEIAQQKQQVAEMLAAFQKQRGEYYAKVEVELVHFALAIAARILHRESQVDPLTVAGLVRIKLDKLQQGTKVVARVHPEEAGRWRQYFSDNPNVEIAGDAAVGLRNCSLETELGTAEMGLEAQLKEVEQGFFDLLAQRPETK